MQKLPLIVVAGPTASGKTALGIQLAKLLGGEIVSADSMQIYRGIPIATAQPTPDELAEVPHHLIGFLDVGTPFSVADYVERAHAEIADISRRGKIPIMVGGTGLYIDSVVDNIRFCDCGNTEIRNRLSQQLAEKGAEYMYAELQKIDPTAAMHIEVGNSRRIIRALEVYYATGITLTRQNELSRSTPSPYDTCYLRLTFPEREALYNRINARVDKMVADGIVTEADRFRELSQKNGAGQAIGHKELYAYLDGEISLEEAVENLKRATRRYAKRQQTWFSRREDAFSVNGEENPFITAKEICNDWRMKK